MQNTLIDAGPMIALFDKDDRYHENIVYFLKEYKGHLITTWPVITEVMYMLDFNSKVQVDYLIWIKRRGVQIFDLTDEHIDRLIELVQKYSDLPMDIADGSLLVVSESINIKNILTIDSDYKVYKNKTGIKLNNLLNI